MVELQLILLISIVLSSSAFNISEPLLCSRVYFGENCTEPITCNLDHGSCDVDICSGVLGDGNCSTCNELYYGLDCENTVACIIGNGICQENSCFGIGGNGQCTGCHYDWEGENCDQCGNNKCNLENTNLCKKGECICKEGYTGATCLDDVPPPTTDNKDDMPWQYIGVGGAGAFALLALGSCIMYRNTGAKKQSLYAPDKRATVVYRVDAEGRRETVKYNRYSTNFFTGI